MLYEVKSDCKAGINEEDMDTYENRLTGGHSDDLRSLSRGTELARLPSGAVSERDIYNYFQYLDGFQRIPNLQTLFPEANISGMDVQQATNALFTMLQAQQFSNHLHPSMYPNFNLPHHLQLEHQEMIKALILRAQQGTSNAGGHLGGASTSGTQVVGRPRTTRRSSGRRRLSSQRSSNREPGPSTSQGPVAPADQADRRSSQRPEKHFECPTCHRSFGYKHVLQNHERTHTGEKPFACKECGKRFTRDHHLKTHMRLHTGEKPYHCSYCERTFVQVANLRRHSRVHTGEKPYGCQECSAAFSDSNQLKAHRTQVHKTKSRSSLACSSCCLTFTNKDQYINHMCDNIRCEISDLSFTSVSTVSPQSCPSLTPPLNLQSLTIHSQSSPVMPTCHQDSNSNFMAVDGRMSPESPLSSDEAKNGRRVPSVRTLFMNMDVVLYPEQTEPEDLSLRRRGEGRRHDRNCNF